MDLENFAAETATLAEFRSLSQQDAATGVRGPQGYYRFAPRAAQLYAARYNAPQTPALRTYIAYEVGTGKTIAAILSALPYLEGFRRDYRNKIKDVRRGGVNVRVARQFAARHTPQVTVVGFTSDVFRAELARHPAFGIATEGELAEYQRLLAALHSAGDLGVSRSQLDQSVRNMAANFKRRMVSKLRGGFWRFVGYQELVLKIFPVLKVKLYALGAAAEQAGRSVSDMVDEAERKGLLRVDRLYLASFAENFCIFDEIHHAYNSKSPNNWGTAVRYVLEQHASARAVFMTATPARGSPAEAVDLANLLRLPGEALLQKRKLFASAAPEKTGALRAVRLKPGALRAIRAAFRGRVLYYRSDDPAHFPEQICSGVPLPGIPKKLANAGLRFHVARAGRGQTRGYIDTLNAQISPAAPDGLAINMGSIPLPPGGDSAADPRPAFALNAKDFRAIAAAPAAWRRKTGLNYTEAGALSGDAVASAPRLAGYSANLAWMRETVRRILTRQPGEKIMVFTSRIRGLGVETVAEILRKLGLTILRTPAELLEVETGAARGTKVQKNSARNPLAVRAVVVHSDLEARGLARRLELFNRPDNATGGLVAVLIASEVLEEGREVKCVRHQLTLNLPDDVASYKQLRGRVARYGSHSDLPPGKRTVTFYIGVTEFDLRGAEELPTAWAMRYGALGWDVDRWGRAMEEYQIIREIERAIHEAAAGVEHLGISMGDLHAKSPGGCTGFLAPLPFDANFARQPPASRAARRAWNYYAYGYDKTTVRAFAAAVRKMFLAQPVWRYDDLVRALVEGAPVARSADTDAFDPKAVPREDFAAAVSSLVADPFTHAAPQFRPTGTHSSEFRIVERGNFLMLVPPGGAAYSSNLRGDSGAASVQLDYDYADQAVFASRGEPQYSPAPPPNVSWFARTVKRRYNFQVQRDAWAVAIGAMPRLTARESAVLIAAQFDRFNSDFHYSLLRELITGRSTMVDRPLLKQVRPVLLAAYAAYGFIVAPAAVRRALGGDGSGFFEGHLAHVYMRGRGWSEQPRERMQAPAAKSPVKEAGTIGLYEVNAHEGNLISFKLRGGGAHMRARRGDKRTLERGIACGSKKKEAVVELADGIRVPGGERGSGSVRELCDAIKRTLLQREYDARASGARQRFFWMFNDVIPTADA
jgi:hypothetical protein